MTLKILKIRADNLRVGDLVVVNSSRVTEITPNGKMVNIIARSIIGDDLMTSLDARTLVEVAR